MLHIPKLAKGGIIDNNLPLMCADEKGKSLFYDKYYRIYKCTKNRRIKKKQEKKSWTLKLQKLLPSELENGQVHIFINNKEITREV